MSFYHSWIYEKVINTEWFLWVIFYSFLAINMLSPVIVWYVISGRKALKKHRSHTAEAEPNGKKNS